MICSMDNNRELYDQVIYVLDGIIQNHHEVQMMYSVMICMALIPAATLFYLAFREIRCPK
jgi:hypothetical protein